MRNVLLSLIFALELIYASASGQYIGSVVRPDPVYGFGETNDICEEEKNVEPEVFVLTEPVPDPEPVQEVVQQEPVYISYNNDDLYVLAHVICGEAQGCSWELQAAVGSVVLNRVNHPAFPDSISGVVFQSGQYACTWDGNYYREPTSTNWEVAQYLLNNGSTLPWYVIFQAGSVIGDSYYSTIENVVFSYNSWDVY